MKSVMKIIYHFRENNVIIVVKKISLINIILFFVIFIVKIHKFSEILGLIFILICDMVYHYVYIQHIMLLLLAFCFFLCLWFLIFGFYRCYCIKNIVVA